MASNGLAAEELEMPTQMPIPMPDPTLNNAAAATFAMIPGAPTAMSLFGGRGIRNAPVAQNIAFSSVTPAGYPFVTGFPINPFMTPNAFSAATQPIAYAAAAANVMYHQDVGVGPMIYSSPASNNALQPCLVSSMGSYAGGCPCMIQQPCGLHSALGTSVLASQANLLPTAQASTAYRSVAPPLVAPLPMDPTPHPQVPQSQYVGHLPASFRNGRMKRPAPGSTTPSSTSGVSGGSSRNQMPKVRRVASVSNREREDEALFDSLPSSADIARASAIIDAAVPSTADRRTCNACGCQRTPSCLSCGCHQLSLQNHVSMCACSSTSQSTAATPAPSSPATSLPLPRREVFDMNAAQSNLLMTRRLQDERQRYSNNAFYQRQQEALRRHHPVLFLPHHPQLLTVVAGETLLFPGAAGGLIAAAAGHMNGERPPVGASIEEIQKCTEKIPFVKNNGVPEEEEERCTVCLMNFESGEELRSLQCSHLFHVDCIDRWLIYNKTCPVCRLEIDNTKAVISDSGTTTVAEEESSQQPLAEAVLPQQEQLAL